MTAFNPDVSFEDPLDWIVLRDGGVSLYWRSEFLAEDLNWLQQRKYRIVSFNTDMWRSEEEMHESLQTALAFPAYYGRNLDALNECVWDDLVVPDTGGLVIVLRGYDSFVKVSGRRVADQKSTA